MKNKKAFTLIELIIVILIIGIVIGFTIPFLLKIGDKARQKEDEILLQRVNLIISEQSLVDKADYYETDYLLTLLKSKGIDLVSKAGSCLFQYDYSLNKVVLTKPEKDEVNLHDGVTHPLLYNPYNVVRKISVSSLLVVDQRITPITQLIALITSFPHLDNDTEFASLLAGVPQKYHSHFEFFSLANSFYISNDVKGSHTAEYVFIDPKISVLPIITDLVTSRHIYFPQSVSRFYLDRVEYFLGIYPEKVAVCGQEGDIDKLNPHWKIINLKTVKNNVSKIEFTDMDLGDNINIVKKTIERHVNELLAEGTYTYVISSSFSFGQRIISVLVYNTYDRLIMKGEIVI